MSNSNRGPSIDASYHVSVHLAKLFQSRRFLEIDQQTWLPQAILVLDWSISKKSSSLKLLCQNERNLMGRFCIKWTFFNLSIISKRKHLILMLPLSSMESSANKSLSVVFLVELFV
jgi:hypothetical protein